MPAPAPAKSKGSSSGGRGASAGKKRSREGAGPWSHEEEEALKHGVAQFGFGQWQAILQAGGFKQGRTNVNLKDKARNLGLCAASTS